MNFRFVIGQLGVLLLVLSVCMLAVTGWAAWLLSRGDAEESLAITALVISAALGGAAGGLMWLGGLRTEMEALGRREALLLVALSWVLGAALSALPFYFWAHLHRGNFPGQEAMPLVADQPSPTASLSAEHVFLEFTNCYFEAMSGLTTAGSSILTHIEAVPKGLLLWRSMTQWLGGVGIVVMFVAVLPSLGVGGRKLFRAETSGLTKGSIHPQIRDTARVLWFIYAGLTLVQIIALRIAGMSWFDSVNHAFTTMATGGYSPKNASLGHFHSWAIQAIVVVFMILGAVNFNLYYKMMRGNWREAIRDSELHVFLAILGVGAILVVGGIYLLSTPITISTGERIDPTLTNAARYGVFQLVSRATTTGYAIADDNGWPFIARIALFGVMFIGGCAGSTAGGIKVVRIWVMLKILIAEVERVFRPNVVRPLRLGKTTIEQNVKLTTLAFILSTLTVWIVSSCLLTLFELPNPARDMDFLTAASATIAVFSTVGPGFGHVGAVENFAWISTPGKLLLCLVMVIGRLEVFTILALLSPAFWKQD